MFYFEAGRNRPSSVSDLDPSVWDVQKAAFEETLLEGPTQKIHDFSKLGELGDPNDPLLDKDEIKATTNDAGVHLQGLPEKGVNRAQLNFLIERQRERDKRQLTLELGDANFFEMLPASIAGSMVDPIWLGADLLTAGAFTKFKGAAVGAKALLKRGAAEGAIAAGATEPLTHYFSDKLGDRYTVQDSVMAMGMGALAGGILSAGIGSVSQWAKRGSILRERAAKMVDKDGNVLPGVKEKMEEVDRIDAEITEIQTGMLDGTISPEARTGFVEKTNKLIEAKDKLLDALGLKAYDTDMVPARNIEEVTAALDDDAVVTYRRKGKKKRIIAYTEDTAGPYIDEDGRVVRAQEVGMLEVKTRGDAVRVRSKKGKFTLTTKGGEPLPKSISFMDKRIVQNPKNMGPHATKGEARSFSKLPREQRNAMMLQALKQASRGKKVDISTLDMAHYDSVVRRLDAVDKLLSQSRKLVREQQAPFRASIETIKRLEARRAKIISELGGNHSQKRTIIPKGDSLVGNIRKSLERGDAVSVTAKGKGTKRVYSVTEKSLVTEDGLIPMSAIDDADTRVSVRSAPTPGPRPAAPLKDTASEPDQTPEPQKEAGKRIEEIKKEIDEAKATAGEELEKSPDIAAAEKYAREIDAENKRIEEVWGCINVIR